MVFGLVLSATRTAPLADPVVQTVSPTLFSAEGARTSS